MQEIVTLPHSNVMKQAAHVNPAVSRIVWCLVYRVARLWLVCTSTPLHHHNGPGLCKQTGCGNLRDPNWRFPPLKINEQSCRRQLEFQSQGLVFGKSKACMLYAPTRPPLRIKRTNIDWCNRVYVYLCVCVCMSVFVCLCNFQEVRE